MMAVPTDYGIFVQNCMGSKNPHLPGLIQKYFPTVRLSGQISVCSYQELKELEGKKAYANVAQKYLELAITFISPEGDHSAEFDLTLRKSILFRLRALATAKQIKCPSLEYYSQPAHTCLEELVGQVRTKLQEKARLQEKSELCETGDEDCASIQELLELAKNSDKIYRVLKDWVLLNTAKK